MKIRFKDTDSQYDFLCLHEANAAIAVHMGMDSHEVIAYEEYGHTIIALVDDNDDVITVGEYNQWEAKIHVGEQKYFIIEE